MARTKNTAHVTASGKAQSRPLAFKTAARKLQSQAQAQSQVDQSMPKHPHRFKPGALTIREIRRYQDSTVPVLSKKPIVKLVKELSKDFKRELRYQSISMLALTEASEAFLVKVLEEAFLCAKHGNRKEITPEDIKLARRIRGERE